MLISLISLISLGCLIVGTAGQEAATPTDDSLGTGGLSDELLLLQVALLDMAEGFLEFDEPLTEDEAALIEEILWIQWQFLSSELEEEEEEEEEGT